jgi:hypothetical protein
MCADPGCPRAAHWGAWCDDHRPPPTHIGVAHNLTADDMEAIRAEVDAKAGPLFLLAMDWILRKQLATIGLELAAPVTVTRTDEEPA